MRTRRILSWTVVALVTQVTATFAAGTLMAVDSAHEPIRIESHDVRVVINNGFARTEVNQTFFNPNTSDLEALYSFPLPKSASLSEVTIYAGELELNGEVLPKGEAEALYEEEKDQGQDAGLASKNGYQSFEFRVSRVPAGDRTRIRFVYYQPIAIDTGVGRYLYPLEDGGTDDLAARSFWVTREAVEGAVTFELELKSAAPVADVRVPGFESETVVEELEPGHYRVRLERHNAALDRDIIFYYRLADHLPGRLEVISYRADASEPGTFMMVLTPGIDLAPLTGGSDYSFVLDVSGSMAGKIHTLSKAVAQAIDELRPEDRFRIVTFASHARRFTPGWVDATQENVDKTVRRLTRLSSGGSTNLFAGLRLGLEDLDDDRATSLILVTDAVTNQGVLEPLEFHKLMHRTDIRVFGFLLGNSGNWPLMQTVCAASGGFWTQVSNEDDILGQIVLAKSKVTHEALHDVELEIRGVDIFDDSTGAIGKVFRGQQVVAFGRYRKPGRADVQLKARLTGKDETYRTTVVFPEIDTDNPELERLWALHRIESFEAQTRAGLLPQSELTDISRQLGVDYQLVTDETSMVVLSDAAYHARGIDRRNQRRTAREHAAQIRRAPQPIRSYRADEEQPMFKAESHSTGNSGVGFVDPLTASLALLLGAGALARRRRK
ncbi:MAG: VIT and VWA domain-containing protein [Acidobacteria bacterium]|nr:VIT and VWA domain-containing protein [Acidobacteriota bacterium]